MGGKRVDLFQLGQLTFEKPDTEAFPGLALAYRAARTAGTMPTVYNAANEIAVERFLKGTLSYQGIAELIGAAMERHRAAENPTVEEILETQRETEAFAGSYGTQ